MNEPRSVQCPKCYAPADKACIGPRGDRIAHHAERLVAAGDKAELAARGSFDAGWQRPVEPEWCRCAGEVICQRHRSIGLAAIARIREKRNGAA